MNLRCKGKVDGCGFDFKRLFYMSAHSVHGEVTCAYGKKRVFGELTDLWLNKKIKLQGLEYDDSAVALTADEMSTIPAAEFLTHPDKLPLEVTVRDGNMFTIAPDEVKYWPGQSAEFSEPFAKLKDSNNAL
jgi:hypothetical protein